MTSCDEPARLEADTDEVVPADRAAHWKSVVSGAFVPLTPQPRVPAREFAGRVVSVPLDDGTVVSRVTSRAQVVRRGPHELARGGASLFVNAQVRGTGAATQAGRTAHLGPGDVVVLDSRHPFHLDYSGDFEQLTFAVPTKRAVAARLPDVGDMTATLLPAPAAGVLADHVRVALAADLGLDLRLRTLLAEQLLQLLAHVAAAATPSRPDLLRRALALLADRCDDPGVRPRDLADELHVSMRALQQAFADAGLTVRGTLLQQRLTRIRADLADPRLAHLGIAAIGARSGLPDPARLARTYRAAYGRAPSADRRTG